MPLINTKKILDGLSFDIPAPKPYVSSRSYPAANYSYTSTVERKAIYDQYVLSPEDYKIRGGEKGGPGRNGTIPNSDLVDLGQIGHAGMGLKSDAAMALFNMWDRMLQVFPSKVKPKLTSAYRSYEKQYDFLDIELFIQKGGQPFNSPYKSSSKFKRGSNGGTAVAWPGKSNHGNGVAIDIGANSSSYKKYVRSWIKVYGMDYRFSWYDGYSAKENWHFVYIGNSTDATKNIIRYGEWNRDRSPYFYDEKFDARTYIKNFKT